MRFLFFFVFSLHCLVGSPKYAIQAVGFAGVVGKVGLSDNGIVTGYSVDRTMQKTAWVEVESATSMLGRGAIAGGISGSGLIAGTSATQSGPQASVWDGSTTQIVPVRDSFGIAVNDHGAVTGAALHGSRSSAFVHSQGETTWIDAGAWSSAYDINDSGEVAGYYLSNSGLARAFTWSEAAGFSELSYRRGASTYAHDVNDLGMVAGAGLSMSSDLQAVFWAGNGYTDLGTLGGTASAAYGLNNSGAIVGYSLNAARKRRAFIWHGGFMTDLNRLIESSSGWSLTDAYAINDAGQIAGTGRYRGEDRAFLLTPLTVTTAPSSDDSVQAVPEPGTAFLAGAALIAGSLVLKRYRP